MAYYNIVTQSKECVQNGNQKIIIASKQAKFNEKIEITAL